MKKTLLRTLTAIVMIGATAPHTAQAFDWSNLTNMAQTAASYVPSIGSYATQAAGFAGNATQHAINAAPESASGKAFLIITAAGVAVGGMKLAHKIKERYIDSTQQEQEMIRFMLNYPGSDFSLYKDPEFPMAGVRYTVGKRIEEISKMYLASARIKQLEALQDEIRQNITPDNWMNHMQELRDRGESY